MGNRSLTDYFPHMRNVLPNPFLPNGENEKREFELDADAFLEALEIGVVPGDNNGAHEAPSVAPTYPAEFENYDLEELAGLIKPNRWREGPAKRSVKRRPEH